MTILFGHPTGNPNSHHAALAHFERGRLESFCVPWMPHPTTVYAFEAIPMLRTEARRLARRYFEPLRDAPKTQARISEINRLLRRQFFGTNDHVAHDANRWLMRVMTHESRRPGVSAVHAYEDCSLLQFESAKKSGKACIYDLPIGYYAAWHRIRAGLEKKYSDWLSPGSSPDFASASQKRREVELADLILVPSRFVAETVREFHSEKAVALAPYGVYLDDNPEDVETKPDNELTFIFVGQCSLRKGTPMLLEAWRASAISGARLLLVGSWKLNETAKKRLPAGCHWLGPVSANELREIYRTSDILVLPSYFEGFPLVILEAMAYGLPVIATTSAGASDIVSEDCGRLIESGDHDALVDALRWLVSNRESLPQMRRAARARAAANTWECYRRAVSEAVAPYV